jgi:HD-like signal output (HDOD) protein
LPTLPTIVLQLHRVLDDPDAGASEVAAVIEQDPALTVRLLRAVNSSAFARSGPPISSVTGAVSMLGVNQVRAVCVVLAVMKAFGGPASRFDARVFWTHSATVAQLARELWDRVGLARSVTPDDAYVVGLLHDVGLLVLDQHFREDLDDVLAMQRDGESLAPLEEQQLGMDHGAVAGLLIGRWQLPSWVAEAVSHHNHPGDAPPEVSQLAKVIAAAEAMCWEADLGLPIEGRPLAPATALLLAIGVPPQEVDHLLAGVKQVHARAASCLA